MSSSSPITIQEQDEGDNTIEILDLEQPSQPISIEDDEEEDKNEDDISDGHTFMPPSIDRDEILSGRTHTYFSPVPAAIKADLTEECVLGVDEAGRGPVLGPMVYGVYYIPTKYHYSFLRDRYKFTDSKVLSAQTRLSLMKSICTPETEETDPTAKTAGSKKGVTKKETKPEKSDQEEGDEEGEEEKEEDEDDGQEPDLHTVGGFATMALSAPSISSGMLPAAGCGAYNLNAQAMDATVALIKGVMAMNVNIKEIYVDTIGRPETYQAKLARLFPTTTVVVEKKADLTYPVVSAASVAAKVTRDFALEVLWDGYQDFKKSERIAGGGTDKTAETSHWGCGYPSDGKTISWLKSDIHPLFGWGPECRFSWATAKDMLTAPVTKGSAAAANTKADRAFPVEWAPEDASASSGMSIRDMIDSFTTTKNAQKNGAGGGVEKARSAILADWYVRPVEGDFAFY